jgi:hypothetical protein
MYFPMHDLLYFDHFYISTDAAQEINVKGNIKRPLW